MQPSTSPNPAPRDDALWRREVADIGLLLDAARVETLSLKRSLLLRKYSPDQPRVPAGNSGGGQWTSGGGGGGGSGSVMDLGFGLGLGGYEDSAESATGLAPADDEPWSSYSETLHDDGSLASSEVTHRDGSRINSEYAKPSEASSWDERHTITLPEGGEITFETAGRTQTIRDGGPDGKILSQTSWEPSGPEPEARVQQTFAPAIVVVAPAVVAAGAVLFGWLSQQDRPGGQQAVMALVPRDYRPTEGQGAVDLNFVGKLTKEEVEQACQRMPDVQNFADRAAMAAGSPKLFPSPQTYGTDVHMRFKKFIDDLYDINFRAERSFAKEWADPTDRAEVQYGYPGSFRVDAYEYNPVSGTLCIYDLKTGRRGLSISRADALARAAAFGFNNIRRIIVTEARPEI